MRGGRAGGRGGGGTLDDMFHNQNASNSPHENMLQMENRATGARLLRDMLDSEIKA